MIAAMCNEDSRLGTRLNDDSVKVESNQTKIIRISQKVTAISAEDVTSYRYYLLQFFVTSYSYSYLLQKVTSYRYSYSKK